jgi:hypothetical protein
VAAARIYVGPLGRSKHHASSVDRIKNQEFALIGGAIPVIGEKVVLQGASEVDEALLGVLGRVTPRSLWGLLLVLHSVRSEGSIWLLLQVVRLLLKARSPTRIQ